MFTGKMCIVGIQPSAAQRLWVQTGPHNQATRHQLGLGSACRQVAPICRCLVLKFPRRVSRKSSLSMTFKEIAARALRATHLHVYITWHDISALASQQWFDAVRG